MASVYRAARAVLTTAEKRQDGRMTSLDDVARLGRQEQGLAVISTVRADGTVQASLVNAGVMPHPITDEPCLAFVTYGKVKLANLRRRPQLVATFRSGWQWASVEGDAELIGPDDPHPDVDAERLRLLLREVFSAAGGTHDNWAEYDRVMAEQRRTVVLVTPERLYSNPQS
jgi:PPOX class probable F420-dependent enzyme